MDRLGLRGGQEGLIAERLDCDCAGGCSVLVPEAHLRLDARAQWNGDAPGADLAPGSAGCSAS